MQSSNRIIINTLSQYIRTIINMLLSLYSARLVLDILGVTDWHICTCWWCRKPFVFLYKFFSI